MLKVVGLLLLSVCGCEYLVGRDTGPFECPADGDRFVPDLDTADVWKYETNLTCEKVSGASTDYDPNEHCIYNCQPEMCATGYVGYYCVQFEHLEGWANDVGGARAFGFQSWYDDEGLQSCAVTCTPGYEEPK